MPLLARNAVDAPRRTPFPVVPKRAVAAHDADRLGPVRMASDHHLLRPNRQHVHEFIKSLRVFLPIGAPFRLTGNFVPAARQNQYTRPVMYDRPGGRNGILVVDSPLEPVVPKE